MVYESGNATNEVMFNLLQLLLLENCDNQLCKRKTEFLRLKYENMHLLWPDFHANDITNSLFLKNLRDAKNYNLLSEQMNLSELED